MGFVYFLMDRIIKDLFLKERSKEKENLQMYKIHSPIKDSGEMDNHMEKVLKK